MSENTIIEGKPTYFELFSRVLDELKWRSVSSFSAIEKDEHKRILRLLNAVNAEVLSSWVWNFQILSNVVHLEKNKSTVLSNFEGKILEIKEGEEAYKYVHPALINSSCNSNVYSNIGPLILVPAKNVDRMLNVSYATNLFAYDKNGERKAKMEVESDTSAIPTAFVEGILVYGTLMRAKANPAFAKFGFWRTMYYNSINLLRSAGNLCAKDTPYIKLGL